MVETAPQADATPEDHSGVSTREIAGRGVATFAARAFVTGDVILLEKATTVSALAANKGRNEDLWEALKRDERARRSTSCDPLLHLGALVALRDLGAGNCRADLLGLCCEGLAEDAFCEKRDAAPLRSMIKGGLLPQTASSFSAREYSQLLRVITLNGFRYNEGLNDDHPHYDVGEALFKQIARINHTCDPNAEFTLSWSDELGTVVNCITALRSIRDGEEISISYLPVRLRATFAERRKQLSQHWGFECDCTRCIEEGYWVSMATDKDEKGAEKKTPNGYSGSDARLNDLPAAVETPRSDDSSEGIGFDDLHDPDAL